VASSRRARFVALTSVLARLHVATPATVIASGRVLVDGRVIKNPAALVRADAAVRVLPERRLRGDIKLSHALRHFDVPVRGRVAGDLGASAGGFTTALLTLGARRVYAVDVGVGQLVGTLRSDRRVVNLEGHNLGALADDVIPEALEVLTLDVGYLPIAEAIPQVETLPLHADAHLVALVKPTFELRRARLTNTEGDIDLATQTAVDALRGHGWSLLASCPAPTLGRGGAREVFLHARRQSDGHPVAR
jgi:23S rRNA (cytidine1920-2'-O)/16S rRNA (cytidine1409-2'-O)-methyltransferase